MNGDDVIQTISDALEERNRAKASGASRGVSAIGMGSIGKACTRYIWLKFRSFIRRDVNAKGLRIFAVGHSFEELLAEWLTLGGFELLPDTDQYKCEFPENMFYVGYTDRIACKDGVYYLVEFKTSNNNNFNRLQDKGLRVANPTYYAQVLAMMERTRTEKCIHLTVNKNNSELYCEIVEADNAKAITFYDRAVSIVDTQEVPKLYSLNHTNSECTWCDYKPYCHDQDVSDINHNCKLCVQAKPDKLSGKWVCRSTGELLDNFTICDNYKLLRLG